ncbi:hypothetical protein E4P42_21575 [Mycobacterium sp. PS03-16]|uniref:hypothetical protein n=1 Tax=Mycobacterium sp. PS03-16 TaxID=2559611 RepID=UPI0010748D3F|nr:hypothetical protein [Mycobacterium sp. PS03-16]TFV55816.1 hypothetical protein E4P42_21575 [Mycobacterium sp. PS03-16]
MRFPASRGTRTAAGAAALMTALSACGGEDPQLDSSNRGSGSHTETTTVENAFIVPAFVPGQCAIQTNAGADLRFTVTNGRSAEAERLLDVSTTAGPVVEDVGTIDIPARSTVGVGEPSAEAVDAGGSTPAVRLGPLDPLVKPGKAVDVAFNFEQAGTIELRVPIEACPVQAR